MPLPDPSPLFVHPSVNGLYQALVSEEGEIDDDCAGLFGTCSGVSVANGGIVESNHPIPLFLGCLS